MMTLWLCLQLPQLPLDALPPAPPDQALAVVDAQARLLGVNHAAQQAGVRSGMLLSAAQAICPLLCSRERQPQAETALLHSLACAAWQFSPRVSLAADDEVVLEIGASLSLFGGLTGLLQRVEALSRARPYSLRYGIAPTPLGAQLLARAGDRKPACDLAALRARSQTLPVQLMRWPAAVVNGLQAIGVQHLKDCAQLPRDGFSRRYGAAALRQLDQLWGRSEDPRENFLPPARFQASLDLLSESDQLDLLLPGFEHLFLALQSQLQARGCGLLRIHIALAHGRAKPSRFSLQLQAPSRDPAHWLNLLQHRFERLQLPEAVRAIEVRVDDFIALGQQQEQLWPQAQAGHDQQLLEQLAARLGPSALYALRCRDSHCPEQAWQRCEVDQGEPLPATRSSGPRPLWLLARPEAVDVRSLRQFAGPERLETAWWDSPCQRDYYRARNDAGQQLWVFRDHRHPHQWLIHGLFG